MAIWPDPRSVSVSFAFGYTAYDAFPVYERVCPADDPDTGDDPGPVLDSVYISRGRLGNSAATTPTSIDLAMRDSDGEFSPRNVSSPRYGTLRQGTPMQVAMDFGTGPIEVATAAAYGWNQSWKGPGIDEVVAVPGLGALSRIGRDTTVRSAIYGSALFAGGDPDNTQAYWPLEDDIDGPSFGSAVGGQSPIAITGSPSFASDDTLVGSKPLPVFDGATSLVAPVVGSFPDDWWTVGVYMKFAAAPTVRTTLLEVAVSGGSAVRWTVAADSSTIYVTGYDSSGAAVHSNSSSAWYSTWFSGGWVMVSLSIVEASGLFAADAVPVTSNLGGGPGGSDTLTAGSPVQVRIPASAQLAGLAMGHLGVYANPAVPFTATGDLSAGIGYAGELGRQRIRRVLLELGIPCSVPLTGEGTAMAACRPGTAYDMLRDAEGADGGVLYELRDGQVAFQPIADRYNADVALSLAFGTPADPGKVSGLIQSDDVRDVFNIVTASGLDGTFATVERKDGPLGSDPTTGVGPRRVSIQRSVQGSNDLTNHAGWLVRRGTINRPRYELILDLSANPDLASTWVLNCDIGSRIQVAGAPAERVGPDTLDLILEGEELLLDGNQTLIRAWCEPYEIYRVQVLAEDDPEDDDPTIGWLEYDTCALAADVDEDDASWSITCTPADTSDTDDFPRRHFIEGELVTVTASTGGTSPTWTVTRSVNGVVKAHDAGAQLELADPLVLAL